MACVQNPVSNPSKVTKEYLRSDTKGSDVKQKKKSNKKEKVRKRAVLPKLPKGACVPGKLYTQGCKKCYCTNEKSPVCTTTCANNKISMFCLLNTVACVFYSSEKKSINIYLFQSRTIKF